jgi:rhamnogalacturonyl hydrolase YesR
MAFLFFVSCNSATQITYTDEEVYNAAVEKGKLAVEFYTQHSGKTTHSDYYADICAFYGACIFGDAIGDTSIYQRINKRYNRTIPINTGDIDQNSCGILPLHLYLHNRNEQQLKLGTDAADSNIVKGGHFRNAIDDMYMTGSLHVQAFRATKEHKYLDFCANYSVRYINALQQVNGLYEHGAGGSKQFWGRGNGWAAAGNAELLQVLHEDHEKYNEVVSGFKKHMKALIDVQLENGMWSQLLGSSDSTNWEETSGTSMFVFALFTGLELGILDKETFLEPAKRGWMAVIEYLSDDGKLGNIANGFWPSTGTPENYLKAKVGGAGDSHGTAGFIWAATSIIRYYNSNNNDKISEAASINEVNYVDSKLYKFIDDGSWCWFQDERAVVDTENGKLIIGTANMEEGIDLTIFDINNKTVESRKRFGGLAFSDDHNSPGILVCPDGNYLALWNHHYDRYNTRYSIYNGKEWTEEMQFDWTHIPGGTNFTICYSNVYYLANEKRMYNFARANNRAPNFITSDDNGKTWQFGGQITTNNQGGYNKGYYKYWSNGIDRIDIVLTEKHPREGEKSTGTSLYHGYIENHKMHDTKGNVIDEDIYNRENMPIDSNFTKIFANGTIVNGVEMTRCWQHDIVKYDNGTIAVLFKARANDDQMDHRNFYARYDGNEWQTTYLGKAGARMYSSEQDYTGLGALCPDNPNRIYLSTPYNPADDGSTPGKREIWRGTTSDNGATWAWEAVTANSTVDNFRPIVPKWTEDKEVLLWFRGTYHKAQNISAKVVGTFYKI